MNHLWQFWNCGITEETVNHIINIGEMFPPEDGSIGFNGEVNKEDYRTSEIRWIPTFNYKSREIVDILWHFAKEANRNAFGFDISDLPDIQYTKYSAANNGKYDWHIDTFWGNPTCFDRKISIVIQLSDPSEYEGGDFLLDQQYPQPDPIELKQKGSVLVFPSFIPHCVTPITKGERKSLVSWIQGPKFR